MPAAQQAVSTANHSPAGDSSDPDLPECTDEDEAALTARIAANEALLAAINETIEEARRLRRAEEVAAAAD